MAELATYGRQEFLDTKLDLRPGQSAVFIGPTGSGKSEFAWQTADVTTRQHPDLRLSAFQPKPADSTTDRWVEKLELRYSATYPFRKAWWESKPRGWVHQPAHVRDDADQDVEYVSGQAKKMLNSEYWKGNSLVVVDDTYLVGAVYRGNRELDKFLIAGRSNRAGIIGCLQAPKGTVSSGGVSSFFYSQPALLVFFNDGTEANREKLSQISMGISPRTIEDLIKSLRVYRVGDANISEALVLDRRGYACIVKPW